MTTQTLTEAARAALAALEKCYDVDSYPATGSTIQDAAIKQLRAALAADEARAPLTDEQINRHALLAKNCPPHSAVMLVSSIRRLQAPAPAAQAAPEQPAPVWNLQGANDTMRHPEQSDLTGGADDALRAAAGPRTISRKTCEGCPALLLEKWEDARDSGTAARCKINRTGISSYWYAGTPTPEWCPGERGEQPTPTGTAPVGDGVADERAAFEAWCTKRWGGDRGGDNFLRNSSGAYAGEYVKGNVQFAWSAWQARTAISAAPRVPQGWAFYTADFSRNAQNPALTGSVMLVRTGDDYRAWFKLSDEDRERVPLYAAGLGLTVDAAVAEAAKVAALAAAPHPEGGAS